VFSLHAVSKRFGDLVALDAIDLDVPVGRTLALIGESGSGKSTLLRLMIGLEQPDGGTIRFGGREMHAHDLEALRPQLGYVIQEGGLFPHLTAERNVGLLARHLGWDDARCAVRFRELAELARLPLDLLERFPNELSGGQRQRVALMRALMLDPEVILLDEPLGALDPIIRFELQDELAGIFDALGKSVVLVTHDLAEAAHLGHELVLLHAGRIVQRGDFAALRDAPANDYAARFVHARRALPGPG
jgi:osmoprotectant transport system ATP-binding protein